ncbi:MAG TPA: class IV adenylate cyclase [Pyrinomonadaceae bacterium]|nr:class IV adenylate cyclase [Pyrinomonadaceae bacterium]
MGVEIEKKYKIADDVADPAGGRLRARLSAAGAEARGREFEENTLYTGPNLERGGRVLRLRRVGGRAVLTFKERLPTASLVKHHREDETGVEDAEALATILEALGYRPTLVYEKRRETFRLQGVEVVIDELPFGLFVEIEGEEAVIEKVESLLGLSDAEALLTTYPQLARLHGTKNGEQVESRFARARGSTAEG